MAGRTNTGTGSESLFWGGGEYSFEGKESGMGSALVVVSGSGQGLGKVRSCDPLIREGVLSGIGASLFGEGGDINPRGTGESFWLLGKSRIELVAIEGVCAVLPNLCKYPPRRNPIRNPKINTDKNSTGPFFFQRV